MIIDKQFFPMTGPVFSDTAWEKRKMGIPNIAKGSMGLGRYLYVGPLSPAETETASNQFCQINYTTPPGGCSDLLFKFTFQIPKWGYGIAKVDEWIETSPTHREYYDRTVAMKDQLANQIKQGLAHAANAISDFELVSHDLRKYKEIMGYFSEKTEHSLKAMFIDQVDVHNGAMSIVQMVQRWSTLIVDFQRMTDKDIDIDGIAKNLNIPTAEAVVLKTKNLLYMQWRTLFKEAAMRRYYRMMELSKAREKSISEYRDWLRPYIVRFKRLKAGHGIETARDAMLKSFTDVSGQVTFHNFTKFWIWKYFKPIEMRRAPIERVGKWWVEPYDRFARENFITDPKKGLAALYPWLLGPYDPKNPKKETNKIFADRLMEKIKKSAERGHMAPSVRERYMYYIFTEIDILRLGIRTPTGEQEDITFRMKNNLLSQNIMFIKLLEMRCREIELNRYIDELLGVRSFDKDVALLAKEEFPDVYNKKKVDIQKSGVQRMFDEATAKIKTTNDWWGKKKMDATKPKVLGKFGFFKPGPYEFDFGNRINKGYLVPLGRHYHGVVEGFLKKEMRIR